MNKLMHSGFNTNAITRQHYRLNSSFFNEWGKFVNDEHFTAGRLIQKIKSKNSAFVFGAGELIAAVLITDLLQEVVNRYLKFDDSDFFREGYKLLDERYGEADLYALRSCWNNNYPLRDSWEAKNDDLLRELVFLWVTNENTAMGDLLELCDDTHMRVDTPYLRMIKSIEAFANTRPPCLEGNLIATLRAPALAHPYSLFDQLEYIKVHWPEVVGDKLLALLKIQDYLKEEHKTIFALGPGPTQVMEYRSYDWNLEPEAFSADSDWMPNTVLLAKSTYVWLNQLGVRYKREIKHLDQIPDEELAMLADRGFNSLWLIGIWERSKASQRIKHMTGNHEALASAYSLKEYRVASDLGGEDALKALREKATRYGIRLACDMVPNHTGIDSIWMKDHPEWFLQADKPPYPTYAYNSENLSPYPECSIQIEDHYFNRTDAAVVFKYHNHNDHHTRYIYHGNDGTSYPWNDTAQLDYTKAVVREAVIQEIIRLAKRFPIIRFDAAMTLAKKHYQRLWFPQPGLGGDIPSRANYALTKEQFDRLMPVEFWREVVDRVASEAPDCLLLAEAFWMMEGYFVRTLGMHRVYNSAFMNMLKNEENKKYRDSIKNTMEFNPEVLKRFVNFMNNPDEEPAVIQFGRDGKYFGVCLLMVTLPGLPMFGHGQVEGFHERYGMEYHSARWDEHEDAGLVARHQREIFPLLKMRPLFAGVENFLLFDFSTQHGVNDDVFCYINGTSTYKALVVYHNKYSQTQGYIQWAYTFRDGNWKKVSLAAALNLQPGADNYLIFSDFITGKYYIRPSEEIARQGLHLELGAFEYAVYANFYQQQDDQERSFGKLNAFLSGGGVPDMDKARRQTGLLPFLEQLGKLFNPEMFNLLLELRDDNKKGRWNIVPEEIHYMLAQILTELVKVVSTGRDPLPVADDIFEDLRYWMILFRNDEITAKSREFIKAKDLYDKMLSIFKYYDRILLAWILLRRFGEISGLEHPELVTSRWFGELLIEDSLYEGFKNYQLQPNLRENILLIRIAVEQQYWWRSLEHMPLHQAVQQLFNDQTIQKMLQFNTWGDTLWFNKESWNDFIAILYVTNFTTIYSQPDDGSCKRRSMLITLYHKILLLDRLGLRCDCKVQDLLKELEKLQ